MTRYEFCYLAPNGMTGAKSPHFAVLYDENMISACERLFCRSFSAADLINSPNGICFVKGWEEGEMVSVKEEPYIPSTTCIAPRVLPAEKLVKRQVTATNVLDGLL